MSLADTAADAAEDRSQQIRDQLRDAIVERRLAPGAKLAESEVAALFDVSRTIARSALQMLAFEGLVRFERNRGAFVANPSPEEAREVFSSRRLIEAGMVADICTRVTASDVRSLRLHLDDERRLTTERGADARRAEIRASGEFHLKLAAIGGNAILHRFMEELVARSSLVIALYGRTGTSSCGREDHARIVDALEARDSARLRDLMLHHIDHIEDDLELEPHPADDLGSALGIRGVHPASARRRRSTKA